MKPLPEYLRDVLYRVYSTDWGWEDASTERLKTALEAAIERYARERVEKLRAEAKAAAAEIYCPDSCSDERCVGPCDCAVGRLKAALEDTPDGRDEASA